MIRKETGQQLRNDTDADELFFGHDLSDSLFNFVSTISQREKVEAVYPVLLDALHKSKCEDCITLNLSSFDLFNLPEETGALLTVFLTILIKLTPPDCKNLTTLPDLSDFTQLTELDFSHSDSLTMLLDLSGFTQLTNLNLSYCSKLTMLPELSDLTQLINLNLSHGDSLTMLPNLSGFTQLTNLNLSYCSKLTMLPDLSGLTQLINLNLSHCSELTMLPELSGLTQLTNFELAHCYELTMLPDLSRLTQLTNLDLSHCYKLTMLPKLSGLTQLIDLRLACCSQLAELPGISGLTNLQYIDLSDYSWIVANRPILAQQLVQLSRDNPSIIIPMDSKLETLFNTLRDSWQAADDNAPAGHLVQQVGAWPQLLTTEQPTENGQGWARPQPELTSPRHHLPHGHSASLMRSRIPTYPQAENQA